MLQHQILQHPVIERLASGGGGSCCNNNNEYCDRNQARRNEGVATVEACAANSRYIELAAAAGAATPGIAISMPMAAEGVATVEIRRLR